MSPFKVHMILILGVYSNASLSDLDKECKGNIPCKLKAPDHPQEDINNSPHQRARRSLSNPCDSETEVAPFVYIDRNAPQTLLNQIVTQKTKQTRCVDEGVKCLDDVSILEGRTYICRTKTASRVFKFMIEGKMTEVYGQVNVGCDCVYED